MGFPLVEYNLSMADKKKIPLVNMGFMDVFEHTCCSEEGALVDVEGQQGKQAGMKQCVSCGRTWFVTPHGMKLHFKSCGEVEVDDDEHKETD